jgi:uncharacterized NAD(P)/FAD-binding protein YdhS
MGMSGVSEIRAPPMSVAIIGAGFSGLLTAIHMLRCDRNVRVDLIEQSEAFGRGRAYATANPHHLLNVRSANMSAFLDDPDHFRRWLGTAESDSFVTRGRYGDYLRDILAAEMRADGDRLVLHHATALSASPLTSGGWMAQMADGQTVAADAMVLAIGFPEQAPPMGDAPDLAGRPAFILDPWAANLQDGPDGDWLLLGTGLTMVDVALILDSPRRRITALSRRGLLPLVHGEAAPTHAPDVMTNPLGVLRRLRRHSVEVGWRSAVDSIRGVTPDLWQAWTPHHRRQFLRHLRPWWDIHRHRMAPAVAKRLEAMQAAGRLDVQAAKVVEISWAGSDLNVTTRPRGSGVETRTRFARVVNCTSASKSVDEADQGLVGSLRRQGFIRADPIGLGLDIGPDWRAIGRNGTPTRGLFAVGPMTRGRFWEAVAVPDLRRHAYEAARAVLAEHVRHG